MLEYGYQLETEDIVHISEVSSGKKCGCICPECKDVLIAKNNKSANRKVAYHFSHQNIEETRSCLMTQLHLAAQQYFLELTTFKLPAYTFFHKEKCLVQEARVVQIYEVKAEYRFDKFSADIHLDTDLGSIYIEIAVTHKNSDEKTNYYKKNELVSLEYNLGQLIDLPVSLALEKMVSDDSLVTWIFGWDQNRLIALREEELAELAKIKAIEEKKEAELLKEKKARIAREKEEAIKKEAQRTLVSAKHDAAKRKREKYLKVPKHTETIICEFDNLKMSEKVELISAQKVEFDTVEDFLMDRTDCQVLKAKVKNRIVYLVFVYEYDYVPPLENILDGAILIRNPSSIKHNKKQCIWRWLQNPLIEERRRKAEARLLSFCKFEKESGMSLRGLENKIEWLANNYLSSELGNKDNYFKWTKLIISKGLFKPTASKKYPSHPVILKENKIHPFLWMFNEWYILIYTRLVEIVDRIPLNQPINTIFVFDELTKFFPLHEVYVFYQNSPYVGHINSEYSDKDSIIKSCLAIFGSDQIRTSGKECTRIGNLSSSLIP